MKKKTFANLIMVAIIAAIITAGVLGVGLIRGWFDADDGTYAALSEIRGIVNIERGGVSYPAEKGTVLRDGDKLCCNSGTTVTLKTADGSFVLSNSAEVQIKDASADSFTAEVKSGEVFINTVSSASFFFEGNDVTVENAVALLSVRGGAQTVSVFYGTVGDAKNGETLNWVNGNKSVGKLTIQSLNDFAISQLRAANKTMTLCFTDADLDQLEAERFAEKYGNTTEKPDDTGSGSETTGLETDTKEPTADTKEPSTDTTKDPTTNTKEPEKDTTQTETKPPETTTTPETTTPPVVEKKPTCTITIRCDTILNNWDDLDPAKAGFVPSNGCILPTVTVEFEKGETVFDVLKRVCSKYGIQIEYSWTPMYNSYYIEGINNLYEFDCGSQSGWMYKVNGWFPNYGCSSYKLEGGETIVWCFTCKGLGTDVGAPSWD